MDTEETSRQEALAPFRSPIFLAMWIASVASYFGGLIQAVGAAWLMTILAPSADMVALVQVSTVLPIVLFSLLAGAAADVWDRRVVMLAAQLFMLAVAAALAGLAWAGLVAPWSLLALSFLLGAGNAFYGPAWQASVREQVPVADLPAAVSLNSAAFNLARAAGPALGGVLVAWAGAETTFLVNAVSYFGLIAVLLTWKRPPPAHRLPPERMGAAIRAGIRFASLSHALQAVLFRSALFGLLAAAVWALMPVIARDLLSGGSSTYGLLLAAFGAGAVGGALAGASLRARLSGERIVALSSATFAVAGLATAWCPLLPGTMLALFVCGGAWVLTLSQFNITVQVRTPRWVVGRALAIYQAAVFSGLSLGAWAWGVAADRLGLVASLSAASLLLLVTSLAGFLVRMPKTLPADLEGSAELPSGPEAIHPESGPVVASLEYRVAAADVASFFDAAAKLRRTRRRNGARRWLLLQDATQAEIWIERFEVPTWLDYLRLCEHMTSVDLDVEQRVLGFHGAHDRPTRRFLLAHVPEAGEAQQEQALRFYRSVYDASLSPSMTSGAHGRPSSGKKPGDRPEIGAPRGGAT